MTALFFVLWPPLLMPYGRTWAPVQAEAEPNEFQLKAVSLGKFTHFIEWPENSNVNDSSKPFVIGLIGDESQKKEIAELYSPRQIKNKKVVVRMINAPLSIRECHLLYILHPGKVELKEILEIIKDKPILTVTDLKGFVQKGIHIYITFRREKMIFDVNEKAFKKSALVINYRLLSIARNIFDRVRRR
jgi:hypothetical protein